MTAQVESRELSLEPADNTRLGNFAGPMEHNLRHVEERLGVEVRRRGHRLQVLGPPGVVESAHAVKQARLERLQDRVNAQSLAISRGMVGSVQRVLVERPAKKHERQIAGRTENNRWVNFDGPPALIGRFVDVVITEAMPNSLRGRLAEPLRSIA